MVGKGKLSWSDFKPGTILWAKAIVIIGFVVGLSYLLSKLSFLLGILFYLYIFVNIHELFLSIFQKEKDSLVVDNAVCYYDNYLYSWNNNRLVNFPCLAPISYKFMIHKL